LNADVQSSDITLEPADNERLAALCGQFDSHLRQLEQRLGVEINNRGNHFRIIGDAAAVARAGQLLTSLYDETANAGLTPGKIHLYLQESADNAADAVPEPEVGTITIKTPGGVITPRSRNQKRYLRSILDNDLNFGIGPAGTGKTYLAVACAVQALEQEKVSRLVLVRPAVEAGERLGFLPGDMTQKVDPYLRPTGSRS
jgi:phosphate starvation-inducible PhoH-like protein